MAERTPAQVFPRRDAQGRVISLAELVFAALGGAAVGLVLLAAVDGILALIGLSRFGSASGWLVAILPAFLFFDEFRAWRGHGVRILVVAVAAAIALGTGLLAAGVASALPPLFSGALGAGVAVGVFGVVWFVGIRWLTGHRGHLESS